EVWKRNAPLWIGNLRSRKFHHGEIERLNEFKTCLAFPITVDAEVMGVIELFSNERRVRHEALLSALHGLGTQIGQLLRRKAVQKEIAASEARKAAIISGALDC